MYIHRGKVSYTLPLAPSPNINPSPEEHPAAPNSLYCNNNNKRERNRIQILLLSTFSLLLLLLQ